MIAKYVYDAWGNCRIKDSSGSDITNSDGVAQLNPFRWKSYYYDTESGLYWIGQRWYDPETGRYISSASPEILLQNASIVFALNLYAFAMNNPVAVIMACGSINPSLEFYYDGTYKNWWDSWGKWVLLGIGVAATIAAVIAAPFTCGASSAIAAIGVTLFKIAVGTLVGAAVSLAIGGTIAGIQSALTGHGFWQGFADSVQENAVDALITSFAFTAVSVAASNIMKCFQCFKEGTLVETENGLKPIEEIEVGDKVLAYNEETGEQGYKVVKQLFKNTTNNWCTVIVKPENGQELFEIVSTPGHKYYLPDNDDKRDLGKRLEHVGYAGLSKKWVSAESLKYGDRVLLSDGSYGIIQSVKVEKLETPETTYNFEVDDFHTYYVGEQKVLVHNANCGLDNLYNDPESIVGKSADDVEKILGDGWTKKPYGSKKTGWEFYQPKGSGKVAYHPAGGVHKSAYYIIAKANSPIIKVIGAGYNPLTEVGDKYVVMPFIIA